jgi:hypothetical protein
LENDPPTRIPDPRYRIPDPVKSEINRKRIFWAVAIFFGVLIIGMAAP